MRGLFSRKITPELGILALRIFLGILFIYAGAEKAADIAGFARAIENYHILPPWLINPAAIMLPWVEIAAGLSLLLGLLLPGGALIVSGLLLIFAFALSSAILRGLGISCGCFGADAAGDTVTWWYLLRDLILLGMGCIVAFHSRRSTLSLDHLLHTIMRRGM